MEGARRQPRGAESERPEPSSAGSAGMAAGGCPGRPLPPLPLLLLLLLLPVLLALLRPGRAAAAEVSAGVGSALGAARRERGRPQASPACPSRAAPSGAAAPSGPGGRRPPPGCAPAARLLRSLLQHRAGQQ